jgi:hypothetical protein
MTDEFSKSMALLDALEQSASADLVGSALTAQERSLLLARLRTLYATTAADPGASAAEPLRERELQVASGWFG